MLSISIQNPLPHEVLNEICHAALCPDRSGSRGLKTLASLARTCRLFHEPAINTIWRSISNILTLIRMLPEDLRLETRIKTSRDDFASRYFRTRLRQPVQSDFARLKHYARRIEHILYANTCLIPPDVFSALATHFPTGTVLLPNILTLTYRYLVSPPSDLSPSLQILFGPKLDSVRVIGVASGPVSTELRAKAESFDCIRALARICPKLSALSVRMEPEPKLPLITVIPEMITAFQDLTRVFVGRILLDFPAIFHLASLQNIQILHACLSEGITQADVLSLTNGQAGYFPSLKKISLNHRSLSFFTSLLKLVSSPHLDQVILSTPELSDVACTSEDVIELLIELSHHTVLTCISVSVDAPVTGARFDSMTFMPLLALSCLRVLEIDIAHPLDIVDELVASMAFSWRSLTRLSLGVAAPPRSQPDLAALVPTRAPTLFSLVSFALFCPQLERLGLPLDTHLWHDLCAPYPLERRGGAVLSGLTVLDVGLSVVQSDAVSVAAFLSDMFPGLEELRTAWWAVSEENMGGNLPGLGSLTDIVASWEQVADLVVELGVVRRQEWDWAAARGKDQSEEDAKP
ncbi:hypothetical protein V8D89_015467 [Ganoderma adspersum]